MESSFSYPRDRSTVMSKDGPTNPLFQVSNGKLLYNPNRDARFPYIYEVATHALLHSQHITRIFVHIVDTSLEARVGRAEFEKKLSVPLGPNALMEKYGTYPLLCIFFLSLCLNYCPRSI